MKMPRVLGTINCLAWLLVLSLVILLSKSEAKVSISCPTVLAEIAPCSSFLQESSSKPSQACCNGAKTLGGETKTQKDRTDVCQCLKQGLSKIGKYDPERIPEIPKACGLSIKLPPIDRNTDCSKVIFMM